MISKLRLIKTNSNILLILLFALSIVGVLYFYYVITKKDLIPKHLLKFLEPKGTYAMNDSILNPKEIREKLVTLNGQCEVKNQNKYGPVIMSTPIVVVQVHRDVERLRYLAISLAQVVDIEKVLLIFSHSFYDENINYLIQQIDFCMVLQIFYPNSVQVHPNRFPGPGPRDCTGMAGDGGGGRYCAERDTRLTEPKHHWWWTAGVVFEELPWSSIHKDMVIFINEDSYVLPDFLYMLQVCKQSLSHISDAHVLSFGMPVTISLDYDKLRVESWRPPFDKGLAFNKTTWVQISRWKFLYCQYDDTSWSYSLLNVMQQFPRGRAVMVACVAPRVLVTRMHPSGRQAFEKNSWIANSGHLFPKKVQAVMLFGLDGKLLHSPKGPPNGNGGWSDIRDHLLCLRSPTTMEEFNTNQSDFTTVLSLS